MAMSAFETFQRVQELGIIPAIRTSDLEDAVNACEAIRLGGIDIIEVSLAGVNGADVLSAVAASHGTSMLLGAGTVVTEEDVLVASAAGAKFIVTPGFSPKAVEKAKELGLAVFAGALTPTEVQDASSLGVDAVKLFPCFAVSGIRYLKALRGQYPAAKFIASGGVGLENCGEYIRAGACAIGVGGEIADAETMSAGDYRIFTVRSKRLLGAVQKARDLMDITSYTVGEGR